MQAASAIARLDREPHPAGEAGVGLLRHLQIVVVEADQAEAERHRQHDPDIRVARIGPEQGRDDDAEQDHQPAHGRRAGLGDEMRFRAVGADRLALALPHAQMVDDPGAEHEHEHQRGDHRAAGAHREVAEHVEDRERAGKIGQPIEHRINPERTPLARGALRRELAGERLDDRAHLRAERALDHHRVARAAPRRAPRLRAPRMSRHSRPGVRREGPPTDSAYSGPAQNTRSTEFSTIGSARPRAAPRRAGPAPACRPARRCAGRAARPAPGRAAPAPPASRPDWRCSFRRSAAPRRRAARA